MMKGMVGFPERSVRVSTLELFFDLVFVDSLAARVGS
jgi:low temperature requirement protein LtrA